MKLIGGENKALGFQGYRGALGGGVPDAGVLLLYHQKQERVEAPATIPMREYLRDIPAQRPVAHSRPAHHPRIFWRRARRGDDVLRHLGKPGVFVAFLTTYCVGNLLIGSALAKPLT